MKIKNDNEGFEHLIDEVFHKRELVDMFWNNTDLMICIVHAEEGRFVHVNKRWEEVLGFSHEELTSVPFITFVHPDDTDETKEVYETSEGELDYIFVNRYRTKDGRYKTIKWVTATPSNDGKYHLSVAIV